MVAVVCLTLSVVTLPLLGKISWGGGLEGWRSECDGSARVGGRLGVHPGSRQPQPWRMNAAGFDLGGIR